MAKFEPVTVKHIYRPDVSFFISQTGDKTWKVGCITCGCIMGRSSHRSRSAADKELSRFIMEWDAMVWNMK